jgi:twinkle protein
MLDLKAVEELEKRGLETEILSRYGVESYTKDGHSCVKIPYKFGGQVVNHKYRQINGKDFMHQDAGAVKCFWNFDALSDQTLKGVPIIITEGEFDALAAIQAGFVRVVSVPDGAPQESNPEAKKYDYLDSAEKYLKECGEVIIATDGDQPGANLLHDLSLRIGRHRCKFVTYPKGCKDLNDALKAYGTKGVTETISRAKWIQIDGVYSLDELPPPPEAKAIRPGFPVLDNHYRIRPGDFTVVTGVPSHGKSTWVNDLTCRMAENHGWKTCFASFEQHPALDHKRALMKWKTGKHPSYRTAQETKEAEDWANKHFSFIMPGDEDDVSLDWVMERCATAVIRKGAQIVVIDPWNEIDHSYPKDMTLTQYTGFAIKEFRKFARHYHVHVILVAHPTKGVMLNSGKDDGKPRMPNLYDISDSSHWYNKADLGVIVHRETEHETIIRVAKSRYHEILGTPGEVRAMFNQEIGRYEITSA